MKGGRGSRSREPGSLLEGDPTRATGACGCCRHGREGVGEDLGERLCELLSEVVESLGHLLCGQQCARRLDVAACRLHRLPATAELHVRDGAGAKEVAGSATVTKGVRHIRSGAQTQLLLDSVQQPTQVDRREWKHATSGGLIVDVSLLSQPVHENGGDISVLK